jgi:hypothetical protein
MVAHFNSQKLSFWKRLLHVNCVLDFCSQCLTETFF